MLSIENLSFRIGDRVLLDRARATIAPGQRVGLFGRNGAGKTTLLRLIAGEIEPQGGRIEIPPRWRLGITTQDAPDGDASLIATVLAADAELIALQAEAETARVPERIAEIHARLRDKDAHSAPARAARILSGLGFAPERQQAPCAALSGGWRMRVALAALLFAQPDLLLLDEPTNHLDLEASLWLEDFLRAYRGTVLLVSHDRGLLNRAVGQILHLDAGTLTLYQGGYDRFEATRAQRLVLDAALRARQEAERERISRFVARFRAKATKAKQAQSRLKMLARLPPVAVQRGEEAVSLAFPEPDPLASPLLSLDAVAVGYGGPPVLRNLSLRLAADDRIALLGANGNGKSTLLRLLAGRIQPSSGRITRSARLRVGYFAQHQADELDTAATPILALTRLRPSDTEVAVRAALGRFGFSQQRAETPVGQLSGGEKARLLLALLACQRPHILLLDEPTNHLDVVARHALVEALAEFAGAVVLVSHDPHVIALTAERFWLVADGGVRSFEGDLDDYRALVLARDKAASGSKRGGDGDARLEQRRTAARKRQSLAPLKRELATLEDRIAGLTDDKAALHESLADPALYTGDSRLLVDLQARLAALEKDLARTEDDWLALHEALERAEAEAS
jgi:ATP-binding cassette subfamily F protein 3